MRRQLATLVMIVSGILCVTVAAIASSPAANAERLTGRSGTFPIWVNPKVTPEPSAQAAVNGLPVKTFVVTSEEVKRRVREIYARGQVVGRDSHAFSKLGDSTMVWPPFLKVFDTGKYVLGDYAYLQTTIDYYSGSFSRVGVAARNSLHTWSVFDLTWTDKDSCKPDETMLACELRLQNPSVIIIRLGVNDIRKPEQFDENLRRIVRFCIDNGVIPILGTKPDRREGDQNTINGMIRQVAADYNLPLWDYDLVAATLPARGLSDDNVHMLNNSNNHNYTLSGTFDSGYAMHDLSALMMLDAIRRETARPVSQGTLRGSRGHVD
jgi:hypothetical protein